jgi:sigma-B regulation protein RsbU (phosphoserine phosphatase)
MAGADSWSRQYAFWKSMPASSHAVFLAGVFFMFAPGGLLSDIPQMGANGPLRLTASVIFAGGIAMAYVIAVRHRPRWLLVVVGVHLLIASQFDRLLGPVGAPLAGDALRGRLSADVNGATTSILVSFLLLSHLLRTEGTRYARVHAEMALARDIHRVLVPRVVRRIGTFEFLGFSLPSGEVGGDLIDVVESPDGWTGFVADVSGHGVASGLVMGMVKSAARTLLQRDERLDSLLTRLNRVLFDLKSPAMFATFAGLQFGGAGGLRFSVAGHLPILCYRSVTGTIAELSTPQLPLAIFSDRVFASESVECAPGDVFLILTDGLTDVFDARDIEFGLHRVKSIVRDCAAASLETIADQMMTEVRKHGRQLDDQTLLLIRALA